MSTELNDMREAIERLRISRYHWEDDEQFAARVRQAIEREEADGYADALEAHFRGMSTEALIELLLPLLREAPTALGADGLARTVGRRQDERASFKGWHDYLTGRIKRNLDRIAVKPEQIAADTHPDTVVRYGAGTGLPGGGNRDGLYYWTVENHRRDTAEVQDREAARLRRTEEMQQVATQLGIDAYVRDRFRGLDRDREGQAQIAHSGDSITIPYEMFKGLAQ